MKRWFLSLVPVLPFLMAHGCPEGDACTTVGALEEYYDIDLHLDLDDDEIVCKTDWEGCTCVSLNPNDCQGLAFVGDNAYECQSDWNNQHDGGSHNNDGDGVQLQLYNIESWVDGVEFWCYNESTGDWTTWYKQGEEVIDNNVPSSNELYGWYEDADRDDTIVCNGYVWDGSTRYDLVFKTSSGSADSYANLKVVTGNQDNCSYASNGYGGYNFRCR